MGISPASSILTNVDREMPSMSAAPCVVSLRLCGTTVTASPCCIARAIRAREGAVRRGVALLDGDDPPGPASGREHGFLVQRLDHGHGQRASAPRA